MANYDTNVLWMYMYTRGFITIRTKVRKIVYYTMYVLLIWLVAININFYTFL